LAFIYRIKSKQVPVAKMIKRCLIGVVITIILFVLLVLVNILTCNTKLETVKIKQNIGGTLICNSIYHEDPARDTWHYNIKYKLNNNQLIKIGKGVYNDGREWKKDEQLIKYKDWIILKTGDRNGDKLIIGKTNTGVWIEHTFSPFDLKQQWVWIDLDIQSVYWEKESLIEEINNDGIVKVHYKYSIDERLIYYQINDKNADLIMIKIE
jgi:hypothetical protein